MHAIEAPVAWPSPVSRGTAAPHTDPALLAAGLAALLLPLAAWLAGRMPVAAAALALAAVLALALSAALRHAARLRRRADQLAAVIESAGLGHWRQPAGAATAEWSPELRRLLGVALPGAGGAEQADALHPDDRAPVQALARRVAASLRGEGMDVRAVHPLLGLRHLRWEARAETDAQGRLVALWGYAQDITDRRAAEERQRQASRMDALGQMAAGLAHDFNNLLCTVVLNLDMLAEAERRNAAGAPSTVAVLAARARAAAERGADLTGQLLGFAGKQPAQMCHLDLSQAVQASLAALPPSPGILLALSRPAPTEAPLLVLADPAQMRAAVQALLNHAQHAAPGAAVRPDTARLVRVRLAAVKLDAPRAAGLGVAPGRYAELVVHTDDEAPPPDLLARLVEPFYRAAADGRDPNGAGVQLAHAHGVARSHAGCLTLEGRPGEGTTARLLLPLAPEAAAAPAAPATSAQGGPSASLAGLRVLLVEDDAAVRETTAALLAEYGALVVTADDGPAALALLDGPLGLDLLLSDVVLPGACSGLDVVEAAQSLRPGLPALLASGYAAPAQELGRKLPADTRLLQKPYRCAELLDAIRTALTETAIRTAA